MSIDQAGAPSASTTRHTVVWSIVKSLSQVLRTRGGVNSRDLSWLRFHAYLILRDSNFAEFKKEEVANQISNDVADIIKEGFRLESCRPLAKVSRAERDRRNDQIVELHSNGAPQAEIARTLQISPPTVHRVLAARGLKQRQLDHIDLVTSRCIRILESAMPATGRRIIFEHTLTNSLGLKGLELSMMLVSIDYANVGLQVLETEVRDPRWGRLHVLQRGRRTDSATLRNWAITQEKERKRRANGYPMAMRQHAYVLPSAMLSQVNPVQADLYSLAAVVEDSGDFREWKRFLEVSNTRGFDVPAYSISSTQDVANAIHGMLRSGTFDRDRLEEVADWVQTAEDKRVFRNLCSLILELRELETFAEMFEKWDSVVHYEDRVRGGVQLENRSLVDLDAELDIVENCASSDDYTNRIRSIQAEMLKFDEEAKGVPASVHAGQDRDAPDAIFDELDDDPVDPEWADALYVEQFDEDGYIYGPEEEDN